MPTYDYMCKNCEKTFEDFHGMNESPKLTCPSCGSHKMQKLIAAGAGLIFKGSGFYINDYKRNNGSKNGNSSSELGEESKSGISKLSSDKKPETKSPANAD